MKNKVNAFTLVELIVVITILAILATIAFVSLQGYSQRAKNAKVSQDLNALKHTIEISTTNGVVESLDSIVLGDISAINGVAPSGTVTLYDDQNIASQAVLDNVATKYSIGGIDFAALRQNGDEFKDSEGNEYIIAIAYSGSTSYYQLAGQQEENSGELLAITKGNYIAQSGDTPSLISAR
jgi:prepilin-type N-terminal cleavage/methylation domain-containing protein